MHVSEIIKLKCIKKRKLEEIAMDVKVELCSEIVCEEKVLNDKAVLLCLEDYYFRCSSYVALTVLLSENEECQEAIVAGFGGGDGISNISWGANKSFARKAANALCKLGFEEV